MDFKYIGIILLILIAVAGLFFFLGNDSGTQNIGEKTFSVPEGFHVIKSTNDSVKMSDGSNEIILLLSNEKNLDNATTNYKKINGDKYDIKITNVTLSNQTMKKTEAVRIGSEKNGTITKLWFVKNKTVYNIQTSNGTKTIEHVATGIVDSIN